MTEEAPSRLVSHFESRAQEQHGAGWSELWEQGDSDLWDRGFPSPALIDIIVEGSQILSPINTDGSRKRALVPGCGRGYDPVMLALNSFDAWGLEISKAAVAAAEQYSREQMQNPSQNNFSDIADAQSIERGSVNFVVGDFFTNDWEHQMPDTEKKFDLIYDYTFLCALHPTMRRQWADRMAELLVPGGFLICLEFPLWKDPKSPGPPWGLNGVYWDLLACGGNGMLQGGEEEGSLPTSGKFLRELYIKPARSYKQGRGEDMLSLWRRK